MTIERANFKIGIDFSESISSTLGGSQPTTTINGGGDLTADTEVTCALTVSLGDGANTTLNLHDGSLTDLVSGRAIAFDSIKALYAKSNFAAGDVLLGAAAATPMTGLVETEASHRLSVEPGGEIARVFGTAVDVTTNCNLKLEHDGTGAAAGTVTVFLVGEGTAT